MNPADIVQNIRNLAVSLRATADSHIAHARTIKPIFGADQMERTAIKVLADRCRNTAIKLEAIINERKCRGHAECSFSICDNCALNQHFAQCATKPSGRGLCAVCGLYVLQCRCDVFTPHV